MYYNNSTLLIDNDTLQYNDEGKIYYTKEAVAQKQQSALQLNYNNNVSHLTSSNVQDAIDEVAKTYNQINEIQIDDYSYNSVKLVSWEDGTDEEIIRMIDAFYNDEITLNMIRTVWNIGDSRTVHIKETGAFPIDSEKEPCNSPKYHKHMRNQPEQDIKLTIVDFEYDNLAHPINNHEKALVTLMMVEPFEKVSNCIDYYGYNGEINSNWNNCMARRWLNINLYEAFDRNFSELIKSVKKRSIINKYNYSEETYTKKILETNDYVWIPSVNEVCNPYLSYEKDFRYYETGNPYLYFYNNDFKFDKDRYSYLYVGLRDGWNCLYACEITNRNYVSKKYITDYSFSAFNDEYGRYTVLFGICI